MCFIWTILGCLLIGFSIHTLCNSDLLLRGLIPSHERSPPRVGGTCSAVGHLGSVGNKPICAD